VLFDELIEGTLLRRYKRFLADVEFPSGEVLTVHCPNTGAMTGCAEPGSKVWLSISDSKTRKYPHTWELVETAQGMACVHSAKANKVVREAFHAGVIPNFEAYSNIQTEVKYGKGSRVDLLLASEEDDSGNRDRVFVEVKSVTLCRPGGKGAFPDAVSERGRKHLQELQAVAAEDNTRAVLFFCVLHEGVETVITAGDIDPRYREAMIEAIAGGVEVLAWRARVSPEGIELVNPLPFSVDAE
jgi:sugar fermentation stimulation protein A